MHQNDYTILADKEDWIQVNKPNSTIHYGVKLWSGCGYLLSLFSVYAEDSMEALTLVGEWCKENKPELIISLKEVAEMINDYSQEYKKEHPEYIEDDIYDRVWEDYHLYEIVTPTDNPDIFLRSENLFVQEWPKEYNPV